MTRPGLFFLICFFIFQGSFTSYAQNDLEQSSLKKEILEIKEEIKQILHKKSAGAQNIFFSTMEDSPINVQEYLNALKNLKEVLKKTKNIKKFVNLKAIFIIKGKFDGEYGGLYTLKEGGVLILSAKKPAASWIALLSEKPDEEPELQKYLADKKAALDKKLKENFGEQFTLYEVGRKILCEREELSLNDNKIKELVTSLTGRSVKTVYSNKIASKQSKDYSLARIIEFPDPSQEKIWIHSRRREGEEKIFSYVEITNGDKGTPIYDRLNISWFDENCLFTGAEINEYDKYDPQNRLLKVHYLDVNGDIEHTALANPPIKSFEEIYGDCVDSDELIELIKKIEKMKRILVTVVDAPFHPNNWNLAYAISRPKKIILDQLKKLKEDRRLAYEELEKLSESGKQNKEKELLAKISALSNSIEEKEEMADSILFWNLKNHGTYADTLQIEYSDQHNNTHGSNIAGIILAGSSQIALLPISFNWPTREGTYTAIQHAYDKGSRLTNISLKFRNNALGGIRKAIAIHKDMLFVVAAGNDGINVDLQGYLANLNFPKHSNMITVASVDKNGKLADFSNFGPVSIDVAAPGVDIPVIGGDNIRNIESGTSYATPFVTNIAAKIQLINSKLTPEEIIKIIMDTVDKKPELEGKIRSGGIVNKSRALARARATLNEKKSPEPIFQGQLPL